VNHERSDPLPLFTKQPIIGSVSTYRGDCSCGGVARNQTCYTLDPPWRYCRGAMIVLHKGIMSSHQHIKSFNQQGCL
jgi:hypothetical protein